MNKYYQSVLALAIVLTTFMSSAIAEELNYNYVSIDYIRSSVKIDGFTETLDGTGYAIDLSYAVRPYIIVMGGYSRRNAEVNSANSRLDADVESTAWGFLIRAEINDATDFILGAAFINGKADVRNNGLFVNSVDADGGVTIVGFRSMPYVSLEISGFLRKYSIEDHSVIGMSFGAGYYVSKAVSLDLDYRIDIDDGIDQLRIGVTKYF